MLALIALKWECTVPGRKVVDPGFGAQLLHQGIGSFFLYQLTERDCLFGGAIGNLIDRALFGHVIDFIQYYYQADACLPGFSLWKLSTGPVCFWPAFNIADAAISLGAALLLIDMIKEHFEEKNSG